MQLLIMEIGKRPVQINGVVQVNYDDWKSDGISEASRTMNYVTKSVDGKLRKHFIDLTGDIQVAIAEES